MTIEDPDLLREFMMARTCEHCFARTGTGRDPHHLWCRGSGGGGRIDIRENLMSLCRRCHQNHHSGAITFETLLAIVARREGLDPQTLICVMYFLRRIPNRTPGFRVAEKLKELPPIPREVARKIMLRVKDKVPAAMEWHLYMTETDPERN